MLAAIVGDRPKAFVGVLDHARDRSGFQSAVCATANHQTTLVFCAYLSRHIPKPRHSASHPGDGSREGVPGRPGGTRRAGLDFFATHETGTDEYSAVLYISIPEETVEGVLQDLYDAGLSGTDHVVLVDTEVDIFGHTTGETEGSGSHARIASAELYGKTEDLLPDMRTFVTMMVLATIVATAGVVLDSAAVVVGSMVLAPLFGPAVSASVGTVIDEKDLFWRGVVLQVVGVVVAVVAATAFATLLRIGYLLPAGFAVMAAPQVIERLSPDLLSLIVALVAGTAGIISIATASGRALVGVMMAAALLPPAAVVGVGIAWATPSVAVHSGILLAVNLLAINFAGLLTLWYLGYRPQSWIRVPRTRLALLKRGGTLLIAILVASAFLWNVTYTNAQQAELSDAIEADMNDLLSSDAYANVSLVDVRVVQERTTFTDQTEQVVVTIGRPPGQQYRSLHQRIASRIQEYTSQDVDVEIQVSLVSSVQPATDPDQPDVPTGTPEPSPNRSRLT